jgi:hypothetical protein
MKTKAINPNKFTDGMLYMLFISIMVVFLASCQKETLTISQDTGTSPTLAKAKPTVTGPAFQMIVINHSAGLSTRPSYKIEVLSTGKVTFTGKSNTAVIGTVTFNVDGEVISRLRSLFLERGFYNIKDDLKPMPDLTMVSTSFRDNINREPLTLIDYDGTQQSFLISLRKQAELMLKISDLVHIHRNSTFDEPVEMTPALD